MPLIYGGTAGSYPTLQALPQPPARVCRVIQGSVWWLLLHWPYRQHRAAISTGQTGVSPPTLASRLATALFVTDPASLQGCHGPSDFAWRVALSAPSQQDCHLYGCAVIEFDLPSPCNLLPPLPMPGAVPGLTGNGAREWRIAGNVALATTMTVYYVENGPNGPRSYALPV